MIKRILCAPDSFKDCMSAREAAQAMAAGIRRVDATMEIDLCPIADGGEGTVEAMTTALQGEVRTAGTTGPLGRPIDAEWGLLPGGAKADSLGRAGSADHGHDHDHDDDDDDEMSTGCAKAIIEVAAAAGLALIPAAQRDPTITTSFGVGEMISAALDHGCQTVIVGLGGSATCDGGCGLAQALGARFKLDDGEPVDAAHPVTGHRLGAIDDICLDPLESRIGSVRIVAARDVDNPLYGPHGAAHVFAPQKGASPEQVRLLDEGLRHLARLLPDVDPEFAGAGAAGGLGFGLVALCGARMEVGISLVLETVGFADRLAHADLVLTGEGQLDYQSMRGKAVMGVAGAARKAGVPVIALVGRIGPGAQCTLMPEGGDLSAFHSIVDDEENVDTSGALADGAAHLARLTERIVGTELQRRA